MNFLTFYNTVKKFIFKLCIWIIYIIYEFYNNKKDIIKYLL